MCVCAHRGSNSEGLGEVWHPRTQIKAGPPAGGVSEHALFDTIASEDAMACQYGFSFEL